MPTNKHEFQIYLEGRITDLRAEHQAHKDSEAECTANGDEWHGTLYSSLAASVWNCIIEMQNALKKYMHMCADMANAVVVEHDNAPAVHSMNA